MKIFPLEVCEGRSAPSVHLGRRHISEPVRAKKADILHTHRQGQIFFSGMKFFPARVRLRGHSEPFSKFGSPVISCNLLELEN